MFSLIAASLTAHAAVELCIVSGGSGAAVQLQDVHVQLQDHECVAFDGSFTGATVQRTTFTGGLRAPLLEYSGGVAAGPVV